MAKTIFYDGTPVTPDWLNSVSSPVFDGQDLDGHRPPVSDGELDSSPGSVKARVEAIADWLKVEHTSGLGVQWKPGVLRLATGAIVSIPANVATLPNNATTQFFVQNGGSTVEHGASFPTDALRLATVVTAGGAVTTITDLRSALFVPFDPIHGSLSAQTQALRDADTALDARLDIVEPQAATAVANSTAIASLQSGLTTAQSDITTLQSGLTTTQAGLTTAQGNIATLQTGLATAQGSINVLQSNAGFTLVSGEGFSISPGSRIAYTGSTAATAMIEAGANLGQVFELANIGTGTITISATGTPLHNMTVAAGASVRYVWDGAQYDLISSGTGGTTSPGSGGTSGSTSISSTWDNVVSSMSAVSSTVQGGAGRSFTSTTLGMPLCMIDATKYLADDSKIHYLDGTPAVTVSGWQRPTAFPHASSTAKSACLSPDGMVFVGTGVWANGSTAGSIDILNPANNTISPLPQQGLVLPNPNVFCSGNYVFVVTREISPYGRPTGGTYDDPYISIYVYNRSNNTWTALLTRRIFRNAGGGSITAFWGADDEIWVVGGSDATGELTYKINANNATLSTVRTGSASLLGYRPLLGVNLQGSLLGVTTATSMRSFHSTTTGRYGFADATVPTTLSSANFRMIPLPDGTSMAGGHIISASVSPTYTYSASLLNNSTIAANSWQFLLPAGKVFTRLTSGGSFLLDMGFSASVPNNVLLSKWFNRVSF